MQRNFLANLLLLIGVNLLIKPFWILGVDRAVQNSVGNLEYGIYTNLFAFSLLFIMLLDFGINSYASSQVARHPQLAGKHFSSLTSLKLLFSASYIVATLAAGVLYGLSQEALLLLLIMCFNQVLAFFILFIRSHVSGLQLFRTDALLSVIDRSLMIIFCSMMIWLAFFEVNILHFTVAQTAGYLGSAAICFIVLRPHLGEFKPTFSKALLVSLIRQTYPYALLALIMTLYTRLDVILIKKLLSDGDLENGMYAQAGRLLEAANMMAAMLGTMLLPLFARMLSQKEDITPIIRLSLTILLVPALMLALYCNSYKNEIMELLYPDSGLYQAEIFGILIFAFAGYAGLYIFGTLLTARGSLKTLIVIALAALLVNGAMNLVLIPKYGAFGAAWAAVVTNLLAGLLNTWLAIRLERPKLYLSDLLRILGFAALFGTMTQLLHTFTDNLIFSVLLSGVSGILLIVVLRIQTYASLRQSFMRLIKREGV